MHAFHSSIVTILAFVAGCAPARAYAQLQGDFVPVGVRHQLAADPIRQRQDLEELRRLRFNVIALSDETGADLEIGLIERLLGGAADARVRMGGLATLSAKDIASAGEVRLAAWYALALGARGVIFGDWTALQANADALSVAVEFADHVTRNAALYAPLRPRVGSDGSPGVSVTGGDPAISARLLESAEALLLIATNHDPRATREATLAFAPDLPEAIWQNMLTGAAVNFVAGPNGPVYTRSFAPRDVLVLMIRKRWK